MFKPNELPRERTNTLGSKPGPTQTNMYRRRRRLEAWDFGLKKTRDCTICVAKIKPLISSRYREAGLRLCFRVFSDAAAKMA